MNLLRCRALRISDRRRRLCSVGQRGPARDVSPREPSALLRRLRRRQHRRWASAARTCIPAGKPARASVAQRAQLGLNVEALGSGNDRLPPASTPGRVAESSTADRTKIKRRSCSQPARRAPRASSPRGGRTSSPRSRPGVCLRLDEEVAGRARHRPPSTSSTWTPGAAAPLSRAGSAEASPIVRARLRRARRGRGRRHRRRGRRTHACAARRGGSSRRCPRPPTRASLASQRIYFVMTDRYANGDPSNDAGGKTGARTVTGFDPADAGWFHGGDFAGLTRRVHGCRPTASRGSRTSASPPIWITPPFGQRYGAGRQRGLSRLLDHRLHARSTRTSGRSRTSPPSSTCAHSPRAEGDPRRRRQPHRRRRLSSPAAAAATSGRSRCRTATATASRSGPRAYVGKPFPCLAARFMPRVPLVAAADRAAKKPAWLNDPTHYHDRGDIDFSSCNTTCFEQGDFFGLDDLFTEQRGRRARPRGRLRGLDRAVQDRRLPDRHGAARRTPAFFRLWLPRIRAAARARRRPRLPRVRRGLRRPTRVELLAVRPRPRAAERCSTSRSRTQLVALRRRRARRARASRSVLADDDYFQGANGVDVHAADVPREPRHGARGAPAPPGGAGSEATLLRRDLLGARRCSTCFAARPSSTTATRSG